MTRTLFITLTTGLLLSCSSSDKQQQGDGTLSDDFKTLDTLLPFTGYWVSEAYFNSIAEFKSPQKAQEGSEAIEIPERTLQPALIAYNFHEGGPNLTVLKNGDKYQLWEVQEDSITEQKGDIEMISPDKINISGKGFVKINPVDKANEKLILEELLFKGTYTNAGGKSVEFKNDGRLAGLDKFSFYAPAIDYIGPGMQVDQVGLGTSEKDLDWFGFKFNKGALELYKLNCLTYDGTDSLCVEVDFGKLAYKLLRKE